MGYSLTYTGDKVQELLDKMENSKGLTSIDGLGGGKLSSPLIITGGDGSGSDSVSKLILNQEGNGQITDNGTGTLFGFMNSSQVTVGSNSYSLNLRGNGTRPTYKGAYMALQSDIPDVSGKANLAGGNAWTGNQQFNQGGYWFATAANHPFVVELENGDELVKVNPKGVSFDSSGLGTMPLLLNGNAGASGQVLTSQGTGTTPVWADIPSGVVVEQTTGQSTTSVMSQKAVTDALSVIKTDKHSQTQLTNQDLNDLQGEETVGWYFAAGSNTCANKPTGVDAFGLEVGRSATGYYFQVLTSANSTGNRRFVRTYSSSWGSWVKLAITDDIPTKVSQLTNDSNYATTSQVNAKYTKPSGGIPKADFTSEVQASLDKADTAFQGNMTLTGNTLYITLNSTAADVQVANPTAYNDIY